ncbi:MAG: HEAT repeat domain-containing protein [Planctomycetes bacterium]|nr:HEAT repeat domain-containing protein [Planctomycetota bacterium]
MTFDALLCRGRDVECAIRWANSVKWPWEKFGVGISNHARFRLLDFARNQIVNELRGEPIDRLATIAIDQGQHTGRREVALRLVVNSDVPHATKVGALYECLCNAGSDLQRSTIVLIGCCKIADERIQNELLKRTRQPFSSKHVYVLRTLALLGVVEIIEPCETLLDSKSTECCEAAVIALGFLQSPEALPVLQSFFERIGKTHHLADRVAFSLTRHADENGIRFLEHQLSQTQGQEHLTIAAELALVGNRKGLTSLRRSIESSSKNEGFLLRATFRDVVDFGSSADSRWQEKVIHWIEQRLN